MRCPYIRVCNSSANCIIPHIYYICRSQCVNCEGISGGHVYDYLFCSNNSPNGCVKKDKLLKKMGVKDEVPI